MNTQCGIRNFLPLKSYFLTIFQSSRSFIPGVAMVDPMIIPMNRTFYPEKPLPVALYTTEKLISGLQEAYPVMTQGK